MKLTLEIWRQAGPTQEGKFETVEVSDAAEQMSILQLLDHVNDGLIEAGNEFEGLKVAVGDGALRRPRHWWKLRDPFTPSWGEPYRSIVARMAEAGLVEIGDRWITVLPPGRLLVRAIAMVFDRYLREDASTVMFLPLAHIFARAISVAAAMRRLASAMSVSPTSVRTVASIRSRTLPAIADASSVRCASSSGSPRRAGACSSASSASRSTRPSAPCTRSTSWRPSRPSRGG